MTYLSQLKRKKSFKLEKDQQNAFDAYFSTGQVCVDAGAGTGKTMTLVEIASEVIITNPSGSNPFKRLLIVTFGVEASRELKTRIRKRLQDHKVAKGLLGPDTFRYLETQSDIQTIDSLIFSMIREIAVEVGMSLTFEIIDAFTQKKIIDDIFYDLLADPKLKQTWDRLQNLYPDTNAPFGPESVRDMIWSTYQKMREFCWDVDAVEKSLVSGLETMHTHQTPPFTIINLEDIIRNARGSNAALQLHGKSQSQAIADAEDVYNTTESAIQDFVDILRNFDVIYTLTTQRKGQFSYTDLAYIVWRYMQTPEGIQWKEDLSQRYDDVMIDEYQDTSYVQDEIIKSFIRDKSSNDFTRVLFIGDVKQSIYQWRSAEPSIFLDIIETLANGNSLLTPLSRMIRSPLVTNFRSHQCLIDFFNSTFSDIFADPLKGAVSGNVPYDPLELPLLSSKSGPSPRIHVLTNRGDSSSTWAEIESTDFADIIAGSLSTLIHSEKKKEYQPADVALLFRRSTKIPEYVNKLRDRGLKCVVLADISLFREPEVSLVIDVLDWLSNPNSKDSLLRILRSPIVTLNDKTLRYLVSKKFYLTSALSTWPTNHLDDIDRHRLEQLVKLRDDMRWDREGPKADLLSKVISHSFLDTIVTASAHGLQAHANLWLFVELISSWESEEIIGYNPFVSRLKAIRSDAEGSMGRDYPRAKLADDKSTDSIRVMTIHSAKGLEFPIVFLCDSIVQTGTWAIKDRMIRSRTNGMLMKPVPSGGIRKISGMVHNPLTNRTIDWVAPRSNSLLWVSPSRDPVSGNFLSNGPWQGALREEQAEFWRLLYVATTRAKDHLFFSVGTTDDRGNLNYSPWVTDIDEYPWTSWMPALRKAIDYPSLVEGQVTTLQKTITGTNKTIDLHIGLDEFQPSIPSAPAKINYSYKMGTGIQKLSYKIPKYTPASLNASTCGVLVECPRRFQYESLWQVSRVRERMQRTLLGMQRSIPANIPADEWGTCVHQLLEKRDFNKSYDQDQDILDLLDPTSGSKLAKKYAPSILNEIGQAVKNFDKTTTFADLVQRLSQGTDIHREFKVHANLNTSGIPTIPIDGFIDLLFKAVDGSWVVVDYKAEPKPIKNCFQERVHRMQLSCYAWLLKQHYTWTVSKCTIVYLYPLPEIDEFPPLDFEKDIVSTLHSLSIDPDKGLIAKPSSGPMGPCHLCPYANSIGGPCENG